MNTLKNNDKKSTIDVVVDLETLGTDIDAIVTQVSAKAFHVENFNDSVDYPEFNEYADLSSFAVLKFDLSTLQFWLKDGHNSNKFKAMINNKDTVDNNQMWRNFSDYLENLNKKYTNIRLWGNGIMFDIGKVRANMKYKYKTNYSIKFWNERDARTLVQLASEKLNVSTIDFQNSVPNEDKHNAIADVVWEIKYLQKAYHVLMN